MMQMGLVASPFRRRSRSEAGVDSLRASSRIFRVVAILGRKPISRNIGRLGASRLFNI